jgi:DNA-binding CsgD family transcriptional regulator
VKQSAVRARIRQLCCLGVPGELLMASLLPALRELVPSDSAAFFWVDSRGEMQNLYAERLLPADVMSLYFERYYEGREASFRRAFLERANAPDGVVSMSADGELRKSAYYNEILKKLEAHHVLYGIVREQGAALGQLSLYRPQDAPAFTPRERADLASVMRYVAHGIAGDESRAREPSVESFSFEDSDDEAMLVTDRNGVIRHASEKGRRLLLLATTSEINPSSLKASVNERATQALRALTGRLDAVARGEEPTPPVMVLDTKWGRHIMRAYWLDDDYKAADALIGVRIQRQEPMILRFVQAMGRLPLSPQQREIALMIAQGKSNQEIAEGLGVSGNTVAYHIKQLFLKLDVHDRAGAVERITAGGDERLRG